MEIKMTSFQWKNESDFLIRLRLNCLAFISDPRTDRFEFVRDFQILVSEINLKKLELTGSLIS